MSRFIAAVAVSILLVACGPIGGTPELSVKPTSLDFDRKTASATLTVSNAGSGKLAWEITDKPDWLDAAMDSGEVTTEEDAVALVADIDQEAGEYSGTITITSSGGSASVNTVLQIGPWARLSDLPTIRKALAAGTINGRIYAVGGMVRGSSAMEEYDPRTDSWSTKTDMPTPRGWLSGTAVDGKLYVMGGYNPSLPDNTASAVEAYDPVADTWTTKSPMPRARWGHCSAAVNGKIYVMGGAIDWPPLDLYEAVDEYDPMTDTWTTRSPMPSKRWGVSCSVLNGKVYAIGGCENDVGLSTVEEYDPASDTWTTKASMPTARWGLTSAPVKDKIYAIGGGDVYPALECHGTVEEFDPVADTWATKPPMPGCRITAPLSAPSLDGKVYVVGGGGRTEAQMDKEVYEYDPTLDPSP